MAALHYLDFDLVIEPSGAGYRARVADSPAGPAAAEFSLPFSDLEIENFLLKLSRPRRGTRGVGSPEVEAAKAFGGRLFEAVFGAGDIRARLKSSLDHARQREAGLRVRLRLADAPALTDLPWEYLYDASLKSFLALSNQTPLVRYLDLPEEAAPPAVTLPLRVIAMMSSPADYPPLDVKKEWAGLNEALGDLQRRGLVALERLEPATLGALQQRLRRGDCHVFHFVGHGGLDPAGQDGALVLEDDARRGRPTSGQALGTLLHDHRPLRLAVLNACEGARASRADPFSGVAQSLLLQGLPAAVAMQFEITDAAAITLAREFYAALADGYAVDAALAEARKSLFAQGHDVEWGTPVLYLRAPQGVLFDIRRPAAASGEAPGQSGGVNVQDIGGSFEVGRDLVGRDQIIININAPDARGAQEAAERVAAVVAGEREVARAGEQSGAPLFPLESPNEVVRPDSPYYVERPADERLRRQLLGTGATVTVRAGRQAGKTSLLMRGLQAARQNGLRVIYLDLQTITDDQRQTLDGLLRYLAGEVAFQLDLDAEVVDKVWKSSRGAPDKFNQMLRRHMLAQSEKPIIVALDKADRLMDAPFKTDFFALVRAWDSLRALEETWEKLNIALVISTEPHLLIESTNQSPFTVGVTLDLPDFDLEQVADLNARHGGPVPPEALPEMQALLGGHPYLVRQALYTLVDENRTWSDLAAAAPSEQGPFGKHLRAYREDLKQRPALVKGLRQVIERNECPDEEALYHLIAAGLVREAGDKCVFRCGLYAAYFREALR